MPTYDFPTSLKKKAVYFLKPDEMNVTKDNMTTLLRGDVSNAPVDQLSALVDGLFLPLLSSKGNTSAWPSVVASDVFAQAQRLKSSAHVVSGQMKGQTLLPLPVGSEAITDATEGDAVAELASAAAASGGSSSGGLDDRSVLHAIETAVIEWSHQVRDVLKRDSAQPLLDGENPGPLVELDFWVNKRNNLRNIDSQLQSTKMLKMKKVLEAHQSSYASAFSRLYEDVTAALDEASDISLYLETARRFFEDFEEGEFPNLPKIFRQILKVLSLIWKHSKYYNTPRHMVILLREVLNSAINSVWCFAF